MEANYVHKDSTTLIQDELNQIELQYNALKQQKFNELLKENQELKQKYLNAVSDYETTMSELQELKKQLTTYQILHRDCKVDNLKNISKIEEMENQQKEFIEYMNKTIEELECDDVDDEEMKGYLIQRIDTFKEILSKYKEIIGDDIMKETYDIIIEKLERDKISFDREISEVIDYVEYDSIAKLSYDKAKAKRDYCMDLIEYLRSNYEK